jgi:hypothetical protein
VFGEPGSGRAALGAGKTETDQSVRSLSQSQIQSCVRRFEARFVGDVEAARAPLC